MHRRLQFGMRENPASDRRHGSRLVVDSRGSASDTEERGSAQSSLPVQNERAATISSDAAHYAATDGRNIVPTDDKAADQHRQRHMPTREMFEPLVGCSQAARMLGNIHIKTLQRYARLGRLPGYQIGGHWYFRESELDASLRLQINSNRQSVR
jgi:hypothetical protein